MCQETRVMDIDGDSNLFATLCLIVLNGFINQQYVGCWNQSLESKYLQPMRRQDLWQLTNQKPGYILPVHPYGLNVCPYELLLKFKNNRSAYFLNFVFLV